MRYRIRPSANGCSDVLLFQKGYFVNCSELILYCYSLFCLPLSSFSRKALFREENNKRSYIIPQSEQHKLLLHVAGIASHIHCCIILCIVQFFNNFFPPKRFTNSQKMFNLLLFVKKKKETVFRLSLFLFESK